jgi:methionine-rich copper-binding protein CopC
MVSRAIAALVVGAGLCLAPGLAQAHAFMTQASPRVGSTVATSPAEVRMWFSGALEPAFSNAAIIAPQDMPSSDRGAAGAKAFVDPKDRRQLVIPVVRPLAPGRYQVKWGVVSVDGHRTEGDFRFTVGAGR